MIRRKALACQCRAYCRGTSVSLVLCLRGTSGVRTVLCIHSEIDETARVMTSETITRAQLLLQYYAALEELAEEARTRTPKTALPVACGETGFDGLRAVESSAA